MYAVMHHDKYMFCELKIAKISQPTFGIMMVT